MGIDRAKEHMRTHHGDADGWITLAQKSDNGFKQWHYRLEEACVALSEWLGEDVYFSQNTFYHPVRRIENVRQLRAIYVDVDHYILNCSPDWVIGNMEVELFGQSVPEPNFIIHSGRGFVVVWLIDPVPGKQALPLWQAVEKYFVEQFKLLGGDLKATDATRIFRIAGSINSRNGVEVTVQYRHKYRYELRQLQADYLPELTPKSKTKGRPSRIVHIHKLRQLYHARLLDVTKLIQLRNYSIKGYRETICFLYRYWLCCYTRNEADALQQTLELNSEFTDPLSEREVTKATRSAEKAYKARNDKESNRIARENGYPGAGYNLKNETLIRWLEITDEEQKHLKTIIGRVEKLNRNKRAKRERRKKAGAMSREEYLLQAAKRRKEAHRMRQEGLKNKEIARELNIQLDTVKSFFRKKSVKSGRLY